MSYQDAGVFKRQLWELPTHTTDAYEKHCTPFTLPSNGVLTLADSVITLTTNVVFQPECTGAGPQDVSSIADLKEPFYASTIPQTFVIAAATVIAWILVIMLIITPRTSFLGHSGSAPAFNSGHGIIGGATGGGPNLIGVGSRPWLQKVAALTVAISLTIATADTFVAAENQYNAGYMDATSLRDEVLGSLEIRISRVISDVFLWLAQVQTLIRLFPRHKEKVLIKWIGFALILLDSLFSCLNSFYSPGMQHNPRQSQPRQFVDAIPALSYLFELALGLLYAAWVMYYSLTKRRYAFYHNKMRSILLIAILSLVAVLTPVVFFVTDVSNPDVAGWGDYFRWVGAAAAAVVVWEWVERIEALERDDRKDGILGREIFDGDEMLDMTPSDDVVWNNKKGRVRKGDGRDGDGDGNTSSALENGFGGIGRRFRNRHHRHRPHFPLGRAHSNVTATNDSSQPVHGPNAISFGNLPKPRGQRTSIIGGPTPPPPVASPIDRADTTSAASTVYVVHYHPITDVPKPVRRRGDASGNVGETGAKQKDPDNTQARDSIQKDPEKEAYEEEARSARERRPNNWRTVANPFKRKRASPPAEVQQARRTQEGPRPAIAHVATPAHNFSRWDLANRAGVLAAQVGERWHDRSARRREPEDLPVTVIPAQPRGSGRTWSPQQHNQESAVKTTSNTATTDNSPSTTLTANSDQDPTGTFDGPQASTEQREAAAGASSEEAATASSPPRQRSSPPRASELSPSPVPGGTTVIPAPSRSPGRSPLATHAASNVSAANPATPSRDRGDDAG